MKILILLSAFISFNVLAYEPVAICGDHSLVVDKNAVTRTVDRSGRQETKTYYQLVVKNNEIIRDFISKGAFSSYEINQKGEFILEIVKEQFSNTQFYGISSGRSTVLKINSNNQIILTTYNSAQYGSTELANFTFNDCRLLN